MSEKIYPIHTYTNGAKSFYADGERVSVWQCSAARSNGSPDEIPLQTDLNRLIVGTDSKRSYVRFQLLRFVKKHETGFNLNGSPADSPPLLAPTNPFEYVGDENMEQYSGISFTPETMGKIIRNIEEIMK